MMFGNYNSMNMLGMNNMFGMNMFGSNNMLSSLFCGTGSIFDNSGIFGTNMFGGGCSLFTNCKGQANYSAMAGFGVANVLLSFGSAAISQSIQNKKANSTESIGQDVKDLQKNINTELKKLGSGVNEDNYKTHDVKTESWYTDGIQEINDEKSKIKGKLSESELNSKERISSNCETKIKELQEAKIKDGADVLALDKQIEDQKSIKKDAKTAIDKHYAAVAKEKELDKKLSDLNKKAEEKQKTADAIIERITDLIDKRDNAQTQLNDAILDKADGSRWNRTSEANYEKLFDKNGKCTKKKGEVTKSNVRFAVLRYENAKKTGNAEEIKKCANTFIELYELLSDEDKNDKSLLAAYGLIK